MRDYVGWKMGKASFVWNNIEKEKGVFMGNVR